MVILLDTVHLYAKKYFVKCLSAQKSHSAGPQMFLLLESYLCYFNFQKVRPSEREGGENSRENNANRAAHALCSDQKVCLNTFKV